MNKDDIKLPPLPYPYDTPAYRTVGAVIQDYTLAAIEADRQSRGEPVAWHTEDHLTDKSATTYDPVVAERWLEKGWPVSPLYYAPQSHAPKFGEEKMNQLFCDLKTDEEKSNFFLMGRGYETGIIAKAIQNDVAMAYHRCAEYAKEVQSLRNDAERFNKVINMTREERKEALFFECDKDVIQAIDNIDEYRYK